MAKSRAVLHLVLALVLALGAGVVTLSWLKNAGQKKVEVEQAAPTEKAIDVVVAAAPIKRGEKLTEQFLTVAPYFPQSVPEGGFTDIKDAIGRVAGIGLSPLDPVTENKLLPEGIKAGSLDAFITPGKRAMAVKGNKVLGLSGLVAPGNTVDVLMTVNNPEDPNSRITKTVLENILVIATGQELEKSESGQVSSVDTYTLELTPEESEQLALAATEGTIHFALRNPQDLQQVTTEGADIAKTLGAYRGDVKIAQKETPEEATNVKVEAPSFEAQSIRGTEVETITLQ
ncbi:Flp pilus assembly protein CpaB [Desulfovibrio inopinatus]|uniref:Flp pilus assembly protein CpaB n=1 Tax=Desulfovibrio inopinatus TaxID=102109 RepID=UPI0003FCB5AC|nr:Flp pilus assembly protein CpaB [Desulfovibrio inopinatus]